MAPCSFVSFLSKNFCSRFSKIYSKTPTKICVILRFLTTLDQGVLVDYQKYFVPVC